MMDAFGRRNCQGPGKVRARGGSFVWSAANSQVVKGAPVTAMPRPPKRRRNSRRDALEKKLTLCVAAQLMPQPCYVRRFRQPGKRRAFGRVELRVPSRLNAIITHIFPVQR